MESGMSPIVAVVSKSNRRINQIVRYPIAALADQYEIRPEATDSTDVQHGFATTHHIDLEVEYAVYHVGERNPPCSIRKTPVPPIHR
jgi:hypothetical protein